MLNFQGILDGDVRWWDFEFDCSRVIMPNNKNYIKLWLYKIYKYDIVFMAVRTMELIINKNG